MPKAINKGGNKTAPPAPQSKHAPPPPEAKDAPPPPEAKDAPPPPEAKDAPSTAYTVVHPLRHDGVLYAAGDIVQLEADQAMRLGGIVQPTTAQEGDGEKHAD